MLYHCFQLLKEGGRLVFIIPDTFLWLHRHEHSRRSLVARAKPLDIALFPSNFFPRINYGYSGMCIVTLQKSCPPKGQRIRLYQGLEDRSVLKELESRTRTKCCKTSFEFKYEIAKRSHVEFLLPSKAGERIRKNGVNQTIGDIAEVLTGLYSGNDRRWLRRVNDKVPHSQGYKDIDSKKIFRGKIPPLEGISSQDCYVPIVRGGAARFMRPTRWYVD